MTRDSKSSVCPSVTFRYQMKTAVTTCVRYLTRQGRLQKSTTTTSIVIVTHPPDASH